MDLVWLNVLRNSCTVPYLFKMKNHTIKFFFQVYLLDFVLFQKVLPWYKVKKIKVCMSENLIIYFKENIRGPNLEFEHLEKELSNSSVWPPLGKNNDMKIGGNFWSIQQVEDITILPFLLTIPILLEFKSRKPAFNCLNHLCIAVTK